MTKTKAAEQMLVAMRSYESAKLASFFINERISTLSAHFFLHQTNDAKAIDIASSQLKSAQTVFAAYEAAAQRADALETREAANPIIKAVARSQAQAAAKAAAKTSKTASKSAKAKIAAKAAAKSGVQVKAVRAPAKKVRFVFGGGAFLDFVLVVSQLVTGCDSCEAGLRLGTNFVVSLFLLH